MLFSIVIPTFNSSIFLNDALESIISQTFEDFEVLILDGLSSDNTLEIARSFNDTRIKIFSEKDTGIYDAMNKGIELAQGEWLYFLGSDDKLHDTEVLNAVKQSTESSKSLVIYGDVLMLGNTSWAAEGQIYDGQFNNNKLISQNLCHQSVFYNKTVFAKLGNYNLNYPICADFEFNIRASAKFDFKYINLIVANFASGGASTNSDLVFNKNYNKIILNNYQTKIRNLALSIEALKGYVYLSFNEGQFGLSFYLSILLFKRRFLK